MTRILCFLIIVSFIGLGSCKKKETDPDICGTNWAVSVSTKATALYTAALAYGTSPTVANCNAYKSATQAYITALQPFQNCSAWTTQQKSEFQTALSEAQAELNDLHCQ
jgi:hypothetical protein